MKTKIVVAALILLFLSFIPTPPVYATEYYVILGIKGYKTTLEKENIQIRYKDVIITAFCQYWSDYDMIVFIEHIGMKNCEGLKDYIVNDTVYPIVYYTNRKPENVTILIQPYGTQIIAQLVYITTTYKPGAGGDNSGGSVGGGFDIFTALDTLRNFLGFVGNAFWFFGQSVWMVANGIYTFFVQGVQVVGNVFGHTGNPEMISVVANYRTQLLPYASNPLVQKVLNGEAKLGAVADLIYVAPEHRSSTLTDLEAQTPQGILGFVSFMVWVANRPETAQLLLFLTKNIVAIHLVVFASLLAFGVSDSIRRKDFEPLAKSLGMIKSIIMAYYKFFNWLFNLLLRIVQVIANFIEAWLPF
ncbi:MAG: hypothetical protein QW660_04110 [Candidatus Bathyarchaeia archaeon]